MDNKYHVYYLIDPRDNNVFYVGKGKGRRRFQHERDARNKRTGNYDKYRRITEILEAKGSIVYEIAKHFECENEAYAFEEQEIKRIGLENLTNLIPGGMLGIEILKKRKVAEEARLTANRQEKLLKLAGLYAPYLAGTHDCGMPQMRNGKVVYDYRLGNELVESIRNLLFDNGAIFKDGIVIGFESAA